MIVFDLYTGFEGEPELFIERRLAGDSIVRVRTWIGYFDEVMSLVPPSLDGWSGIALHYHLCTGWTDGEEWVDPDPADTLQKIRNVRPGCVDTRERMLVDAIIYVYETSSPEGGVVVWRLD